MIDYEDNVVKIGRNTETIAKFVVMFQTPFGLFEDAASALARLKQDDLGVLMMRPVAVAIGINGSYEVCP